MSHGHVTYICEVHLWKGCILSMYKLSCIFHPFKHNTPNKKKNSTSKNQANLKTSWGYFGSRFYLDLFIYTTPIREIRQNMDKGFPSLNVYIYLRSLNQTNKNPNKTHHPVQQIKFLLSIYSVYPWLTSPLLMTGLQNLVRIPSDNKSHIGEIKGQGTVIIFIFEETNRN